VEYVSRKEKFMEQLLRDEEAERLRQRQNDRMTRRELRFAAYLSSERDCMVCEDDRSYRLRHLLWEVRQIQRERFGLC